MPVGGKFSNVNMVVNKNDCWLVKLDLYTCMHQALGEFFCSVASVYVHAESSAMEQSETELRMTTAKPTGHLFPVRICM